MSNPDTLRRFCLAHPKSVLVPAEAFGETGIEPDFAAMLAREGRLTPPQVQCLGEGFALYRQRCRDLFARAPQCWFPPRQINVLVATDPRAVVPYLEPFTGTSALLYSSDLDTHPEYVAFMFAQAERLAMLHLMRAALVFNLSYWFDRTEDELSAFARAAAQAKRPDARTFVLLAGAFDWIRTLYHDPLRLPTAPLDEPYVGITDTGLFIAQRLQPKLLALCQQAEATIAIAMRQAAPARLKARRATLDALCDWLREGPAHVVVTANKATLWQPENADPAPLRSALRGADDEAVASLHQDLRVVHERTRTFFDCLREPASLPRHCGVLESGGGVYLDAARHAVVYELEQKTFDARASAAPPFHRLLIGARVMHEWGHLAHAGKYLRVPEQRKAEYTQARAALGERFMQALCAVPERARTEVEHELRALASRGPDAPAALARKTVARVGDYLSNLMCSHLLPGEEMQAYVRVNVRHHMDENLGIVSELARYAYEIHYLALAGLDRSYFFDSSRFVDLFINSGIISADHAHALFDAAGRVLACYEIDASKLALPATA